MADQLPTADISHSATTSVAASNTKILDAVAGASERLYLLLQNQDTSANLKVHLSGGDPTAAGALIIYPGGNYEPIVVPQGEIRIASSSGTINICCLYAET